MAHRVFADSQGVTWEVWDVVPGRLLLAARDHRTGADRRVASVETPPDGERRSGADRRTALAPQLRHGWLAFRSEGERRRLAPIPAGWEQAPEEALERYCRTAQPVSATRER